MKAFSCHSYPYAVTRYWKFGYDSSKGRKATGSTTENVKEICRKWKKMLAAEDRGRYTIRYTYNVWEGGPSVRFHKFALIRSTYEPMTFLGRDVRRRAAHCVF